MTVTKTIYLRTSDGQTLKVEFVAVKTATQRRDDAAAQQKETK